MKFTVVAVGKLKERFWTDACAEYLKRLQPYAKTEVREQPCESAFFIVPFFLSSE